MRAGMQRDQQRSPFFPIQTRTLTRQAQQSRVRCLPPVSTLDFTF
jgi:hypothetical protein